MYNKEKIIKTYNLVSDEEISKSEINVILPKLYLILNNVKLDEVEIINIIDVLRKINEFGLLNNVTVEIIKLIKKVTKYDYLNLQGTIYFSELLKDVILPYNKNICEKEYNLIMFLSEFEIYMELVRQTLNDSELRILSKYNSELTEIIKKYKEVIKQYKEYNCSDIMLSYTISHLASMLYFNLDKYNHDYNLIVDVFERIINSHQEFVNYCYQEEINKNFNINSFNIEDTKKEYIISNKMLEYVYNEKKNEKIKRK